MKEYLNALVPGLNQTVDGRIRRLAGEPFRPSLPRFMALGFSFEALYRMTVQLLGIEVSCAAGHARRRPSRPSIACSISGRVASAMRTSWRIVRHYRPAEQPTAVTMLDPHQGAMRVRTVPLRSTTIVHRTD